MKKLIDVSDYHLSPFDVWHRYVKDLNLPIFIETDAIFWLLAENGAIKPIQYGKGRYRCEILKPEIMETILSEFCRQSFLSRWFYTRSALKRMTSE